MATSVNYDTRGLIVRTVQRFLPYLTPLTR